jgi:hypothetical protein
MAAIADTSLKLATADDAETAGACPGFEQAARRQRALMAKTFIA